MGRGGVGARVSVLVRVGALAGCCLALANCGRGPGNVDPKYGVAASPRVVQPGEPVPKGGGVYRVGRPYKVAGRTYVPEEDENYVAEGTASWYGEDFHGRRTANGEVYDMDSVSAAHPTLPIPSYVRITNLRNKRSIIARVNDRGPYHQGRVIDVSVRTAKLLGFYANGTAQVRVEYVGRAALEGSDDEKLAATLRHGRPAPSPAEVRLAATRSLRERPNEVTTAARRAAAPAQAAPEARARPGAHRLAATEPASPPSSFAARFAPVAGVSAADPAGAGTSPVSAYAPAASQRSGADLINGRGLY
jgi:rare lipoprotein A